MSKDSNIRLVQTTLTAGEQKFVEQFAVHQSASRAYMEAFGGDLSSAYKKGYALSKKPYIVAAISASTAALSKRTSYSDTLVLNELAHIAFSDIARIFDEDGKPLPIHLIPPEVRRSIQSVRYKPDGEVYFSFWPKMQALDRLGQHFKLFDADRLPPGSENDLEGDQLSDIELARRISHILSEAVGDYESTEPTTEFGGDGQS